MRDSLADGVRSIHRHSLLLWPVTVDGRTLIISLCVQPGVTLQTTVERFTTISPRTLGFESGWLASCTLSAHTSCRRPGCSAEVVRLHGSVGVGLRASRGGIAAVLHQNQLTF